MYCTAKPLLLSMCWVFYFLVQFNNFDRTTGFYIGVIGVNCVPIMHHYMSVL